MRKICIAVVCLLAVWAALSAKAQNTTGDILGTITDTSGGAIPGAKVTVINAGTNRTQSITSTANGDFVFNLLQPGTYRISCKGLFTRNLASSRIFSYGR